jgi:hypothetical protein
MRLDKEFFTLPDDANANLIAGGIITIDNTAAFDKLRQRRLSILDKTFKEES